MKENEWKELERVEGTMTKHIAKNLDPNAQVYLCEDVDNRWIKIEKQLPKHTGLYNVACFIGGIMGGYMDVRSYRYLIKNKQLENGKWIRECEGWGIPTSVDEIVCITHWMPLPELPQEEN